MLWAAIALPELPLSSAFRAGSEGPCAVVHGPDNRPQLLIANAAAAALGVRAGHTPAAARALVGALRLHRRDEAAERAQLEQLAAWAYGYSGMVALAAPDAVLLEVGASLRLFGGWPALERRLRADLDALGHVHRIAAAPTPLGARVLADVGDGTAVFDEGRLVTALGHVAIAAAHLPEKTVAALHAMGLRQLREVLRLPRPELARRIGRDALHHVDRLRGSAADPRPLYRPPDRFHARIEFDAEVASSEALLFPLLRLTRELAAFLLARDGGVQHFTLVLEHELHAARDEDPVGGAGHVADDGRGDPVRHGPGRVHCDGAIGSVTRVPVGLLEPVRAAEALFEFARGRLERVELPAPARALVLEADELPPFVPARRDLFEQRAGSGLDWPALAERLRARLGDRAVRGFAVHPDHRPECAWRESAPQARRMPPACAGPPRPVWLLPRPLPLRGRVARLVSGPERIETGWWDGYDVRRDYWVADLDNGQRAWLYREVGGGEDWMLQGWFA